MPAQVSVFIATSLDGFIARPDGAIDWLNDASRRVPAGEDCGYQSFFDSVDTLVMGRHTFELVLSFDDWPYGDKPVVVLSSRPIAVPATLQAWVTWSDEAPAALVARLSAAGAQRLYVDGGVTIQRFLAAGLIDDLTMTLFPVLLGEGRRLFGPLAGDVPLRLAGSRVFDFGFVQLNYRVLRDA